MYRGTTLSDQKPAVGVAFEAIQVLCRCCRGKRQAADPAVGRDWRERRPAPDDPGYSWFGNQSPQFDGFALPVYLN